MLPSDVMPKMSSSSLRYPWHRSLLQDLILLYVFFLLNKSSDLAALFSISWASFRSKVLTYLDTSFYSGPDWILWPHSASAPCAVTLLPYSGFRQTCPTFPGLSASALLFFVLPTYERCPSHVADCLLTHPALVEPLETLEIFSRKELINFCFASWHVIHTPYSTFYILLQLS